MEVHKILGAGFVESVYEEALAIEFDLRAIAFSRQKLIDVTYKDKIAKQFVCDFGSSSLEVKRLINTYP
jgi:GxxExxY protein